jgi:hypothetical protein|tara:strand:+ start:623 stop:1342 length:720 start_codon:yes stop_codon:yes gene_type:complete
MMAGERYIINEIAGLLRKWGSPQEASRKLTRIADEAPNTLTHYQPQVISQMLDQSAKGNIDTALMNPANFKHIAAEMNPEDLANYYGGKKEALTRILDGLPPNVSHKTHDITDGEGERYLKEGRPRASTTRGFDSPPELRFGAPDPIYELLQAVGHNSRNRNMAITDRGDLEALVTLRTGINEDKERVRELLRNPNTEIHSQPTIIDGREVRSKRVAPLSQLFRLFGLGGISSLPMLED